MNIFLKAFVEISDKSNVVLFRYYAKLSIKDFMIHQVFP
jgi:hypothetical protein